MTGDATLAGPPVARRKIVEHLRQAVLVEPGADVLGRVLVWEEVFDAAEAGAPRGGKPIEESGLVEEHRQVGGKFRHASVAAAAAVVLLAAASAVGLTGFLYQRFAINTVQARGITEPTVMPSAAAARPERHLPAGTALTVLVDSYRESAQTERAVGELTTWLEASGHRVYYERVDLGANGRWWRVLAGAYAEHQYETASWDAARIKAAAPALQARVITAAAGPKR